MAHYHAKAIESASCRVSAEKGDSSQKAAAQTSTTQIQHNSCRKRRIEMKRLRLPLARTLFRIGLASSVLIALIPQLTFAGEPMDPSTLNPPPPDFELCKAVGAGTICEGTRTDVLAPEVTDVSCASGATAFDIIDSSTRHEQAKRYYDVNGNLTRRSIHDRFTSGQWSNALTGAKVFYTQNNVTVDVLAVPGDLSSSTQTTTGEVIIRAGTGAPVLIATGRQVFNAGTGELISSAGRNAFIAAFFEGDTTAFDDVCAALAR
jgi:hypothetical protein